MPNNFLTGSELQRFEEIHDRWLVFEPVSNENYALHNNLFTVNLGQTNRPEFFINSGSVPFSASTLTVEKNIHVFFDETDMLEFINNIGEENIALYQEVEIKNQQNIATKAFEIHVINYPQINLELDILEYSETRGFIVDVFLSSSSPDSFGARNALVLQSKKVAYDQEDRVISDTYLKFFRLEGNK